MMRWETLCCFLLIAAVLMVAPWARAASSDGAATLVHEGQARAVIEIAADATALEKLAAEELIEHIKRISDATLTQVKPGDSTTGVIRIVIGKAVDGSAIAALKSKSDDPAAFVLKVTDKQIQLRGNSDEGTLNAAYELLEQLGVRWYMPGEFGLVVPRNATVTLAVQDTVAIPSFPIRRLAGWAERNHLRWTQRMRNAFVNMRIGGHGIPPFETSPKRKKGFESNPEFFALIDGKRQNRQLCVSNPQLRAVVVENARKFFRDNPDAKAIGMSPNDGSGYCQCANCKALDSGRNTAFTNRPSMTDRYLWFYNQVLEELGPEFADREIGTLAYSDTMDLPTKVKPNPRIRIMMATIHLDRIHGPRNPVSPETAYWTYLAAEWPKLSPAGVLNFGYWFNLADPGFPFIMLHKLRDEIPLSHDLGHRGWHASTGINWASEGPSLYIAAKLMWNVNADVDALLREFCDKFYGPAAQSMHRYYVLMDATLRDSPCNTGSSWDMPHIYTPAIRAEAHSLLQQATALVAGQGIHAQRVQVVVQSLNYLNAFIDMLEQRARHDYVAAKASLDRIDALRAHFLKDYEFHMLRDWTAESFLRLFFRKATEEGFARVTGENRLVAGLHDRWQFLIEPQGVGERMKLHDPAVNTSHWQTLCTSTSSWSNQGLRYYWGEAWYRQSIEIPAEFKGQRIMLWFGGVYNGAKVWVNGQELGTSPGAVFHLDAFGGSSDPFEFDVTHAVKFGQRNLVAVRVVRDKTSELGVGGIVAPVMFYAKPVSSAQEKKESPRPAASSSPLEGVEN